MQLNLLGFCCSSLTMVLKELFLWNFCHWMFGPNTKLKVMRGLSVPKRTSQKEIQIKWKSQVLYEHMLSSLKININSNNLFESVVV